MKIVIPTQVMFEEIKPLRLELEKLDIDPKVIATAVISQWLTYSTDERSKYLFYTTSPVDFLEMCAIEDFLLTHHEKSRDYRVITMNVIKHLVRKFIYDIVPIIENLEFTDRTLTTAKIEWVGSSLVFDVME